MPRRRAEAGTRRRAPIRARICARRARVAAWPRRADPARPWVVRQVRARPAVPIGGGRASLGRIRLRERPVRYAILIHERPGYNRDFSDEQRRAITAEYLALREQPGFVGGEALQPAEMTTTVRLEEGEPLSTDGPFANAKEVFAGYFIFEAENLDHPLRIAQSVPALRYGGAVEIRPLVVMPS